MDSCNAGLIATSGFVMNSLKLRDLEVILEYFPQMRSFAEARLARNKFVPVQNS